MLSAVEPRLSIEALSPIGSFNIKALRVVHITSDAWSRQAVMANVDVSLSLHCPLAI